ncbi:hypothetical protein G1C94_0979 [Bifidobacterium sp. DSM 109963]|uniref:Uncharacterized protein n=1 Tax=Bifidobacterium panos TaxID=2675321 RepID=A0ABX1SYW5_9BIFI|nr:hypothetical protein [Bifidobacterium sp. DSM 109963]
MMFAASQPRTTLQDGTVTQQARTLKASASGTGVDISVGLEAARTLAITLSFTDAARLASWLTNELEKLTEGMV